MNNRLLQLFLTIHACTTRLPLLALNRMAPQKQAESCTSHTRKKQHDHGTSPKEGLAACRTATFAHWVTRITYEEDIHVSAIIDGVRGDHPGGGSANPEALIVE